MNCSYEIALAAADLQFAAECKEQQRVIYTTPFVRTVAAQKMQWSQPNEGLTPAIDAQAIFEIQAQQARAARALREIQTQLLMR